MEVGSRFSFRYLKGERQFRRRTVRLLAWLTGDKIKVYDEDVRAERFYYAEHTYGTKYLRPPPARQQAGPADGVQSARDHRREGHGEQSLPMSGAASVSEVAPRSPLPERVMSDICRKGRHRGPTLGSATGGSSKPALLDSGASTSAASEGCFAAFKGGKAVSKKQDRMKDARACEKGSESGGQRDCAAPASGETPTALSSDFAGTKARTDAARWSEGGCGPPKQKT